MQRISLYIIYVLGEDMAAAVSAMSVRTFFAGAYIPFLFVAKVRHAFHTRVCFCDKVCLCYDYIFV